MSVFQKLVLASGSPRRIELLQQAGIEPDRLIPSEIDETPKRAEHPGSLAKRLSREKAEKAREIFLDDPDEGDAYILAADTVVSVGRRILPKAEMVDEAANCLRLLSGRSHKVHTGVCLITPSGKQRQKLVETRVLQAPVARGARKLPRLGRMARQGGRLRDPGVGRDLRCQADRLLHQRRRPAAPRDGQPAHR